MQKYNVVRQPDGRRATACRVPTLGALAIAGIVALLPAGVLSGRARAAGPAHAIAMHGEPRLPADFAAFPYVDPDAPKGGRITWGAFGSFDSLNPFIRQGQPARGLRDGGQENYVYESLMTRGLDEAFTLYCLICATVEVPDDRRWVEFKLRPEARFSDGTPVTSADIAHSFALHRDEGRENVARVYREKVARVETPDPATVRFVFAEDDKEMPLIMGLMPILPMHAMSREAFAKTSLEPPIGSGPYRVAEVVPGSRLVLKRNPDYWARSLPVKRGFDNFDEIRFDYYREQNALFEAFKAGLVDVYPEGDPSRWQTGYDFPALTEGRVVKETFETGLPRGLYGMVFNTRRPVFEDVRVRRALAMLFDFEWINKNLFFGLYRRSASYFQGSELSALGRPADAAERALLAPFAAAIPAEIMDGTWAPPETDGSGRDRTAIRQAVDLLAKAGWVIDKGVMRHGVGGPPMSFEIVLVDKQQERIALAYQRSLKLIGVDLVVRLVDSAQFQRRRTSFDLDMTFWNWSASLSPGNEQLNRWSVAAADAQGSFNLPGAKVAGHDALIAALLAARSRTEFVTAVRAFDRLLISGFWVVPLYHQPQVWLARWTRIERPSVTSASGPVTGAWWAKPGGTTP